MTTARTSSGCRSCSVKSACSLQFRDERRTVVLVASGQSAGESSLEVARDWPTVVVNDAWRLAPWASALYACDLAWWELRHAEVESGFTGERWTQCEQAARKFGLNRIAGKHRPGLSTDPELIHFNYNGGAQAMNLALHAGARRFVLVGYDMGGDHFFGHHPKPLRNDTPYWSCIRAFGVIAADCERLGIDVVNTSPVSRLHCFRRAPLAEALR
jgi:hypothetical protein